MFVEVLEDFIKREGLYFCLPTEKRKHYVLQVAPQNSVVMKKSPLNEV